MGKFKNIYQEGLYNDLLDGYDTSDWIDTSFVYKGELYWFYSTEQLEDGRILVKAEKFNTISAGVDLVDSSNDIFCLLKRPLHAGPITTTTDEVTWYPVKLLDKIDTDMFQALYE